MKGVLEMSVVIIIIIPGPCHPGIFGYLDGDSKGKGGWRMGVWGRGQSIWWTSQVLHLISFRITDLEAPIM